MNSPTRAAARSHDLLRDWAGLAVTQFAWLEWTHTPTLRAVAAELGSRRQRHLTGPRGGDLFALPRAGVWQHDDAARLRLRMIRI